MADRFEIDFLNELDGQLVSLARRAGYRDDRVSKTSLRRVLLLAGAVAGLAALAALLALTLSHTPKATGTPVVASQVPAVIPAQGVTVADTVVLKPPPAHLTPAISRDRAVSIMGVKTPPSVTVLASVTVPETTVPETMPLGRGDFSAPGAMQWHRVYSLPFDTHPGAPIQDRVAWVVSYALPMQLNRRLFQAYAPAHASPSLWSNLVSPVVMSHRVVIVDAQTGNLIFEFSTP